MLKQKVVEHHILTSTPWTDWPTAIRFGTFVVPAIIVIIIIAITTTSTHNSHWHPLDASVVLLSSVIILTVVKM